MSLNSCDDSDRLMRAPVGSHPFGRDLLEITQSLKLRVVSSSRERRRSKWTVDLLPSGGLWIGLHTSKDRACLSAVKDNFTTGKFPLASRVPVGGSYFASLRPRCLGDNLGHVTFPVLKFHSRSLDSTLTPLCVSPGPNVLLSKAGGVLHVERPNANLLCKRSIL